MGYFSPFPFRSGVGAARIAKKTGGQRAVFVVFYKMYLTFLLRQDKIYAA